MERGVAAIQELEGKYGETKSSKKLTKEETKGTLFMMGFGGGATGFRYLLAKIYSAHGCYAKSVVLLEKDIRLFKRFHEYRKIEFYRQMLERLAVALGEMGQTERAIALQTQVLDHYKKTNRPVIGATVALARLYRDAGKLDRNRQIVAEARTLYEKRWKQRGNRSQYRPTQEAFLFELEGRYEEASSVLDRALAAELEKPKADRKWAGRIYWGLASIHDRTGNAERQLAAMESYFDYRRPPTRPGPGPGMYKRVQPYLELAKAYKQAGHRTEAKKLADEYRLCLN